VVAGPLRGALEDALTGASSFRFTDGAGELYDVAPADLAPFAGQLVIWPMSNDALCVRRLVEALVAGVVPVILPRTASQKLLDLRARYAGFGCFDGREIHPSAAPARADSRILLVLMTSGSTGAPKLIAADERSTVRGIAAIHAAQGLQEIASTGILLPLAYSYAMVNQLLWAVMHGRRAFALPGLVDPVRTLQGVRDHRIEMLCLVAHQVRMLTALGLADEQLDCVRALNFAGAPFPMQSLPQLRRMFPRARIYNNYGCTEALPRLTVTQVLDASHPLTYVGRPIESIELRIASGEDIGPIEFRGASASIGMVQPDGTLEPHGDWIAAGDLGRLEQGALHVLGRHDQVVKVAGERVSLVEIENVLLQAGFEHALVWQDSDEEGRILSVTSAAAKIPSAQLAAHLRRSLPMPLWPKSVFWVDEWPIMASGKTDRTGLQQRARNRELTRLFPQAVDS
jgi:acyl-coenzyme A synthetase/AMP-(fatty) acid ligase